MAAPKMKPNNDTFVTTDKTCGKIKVLDDGSIIEIQGVPTNKESYGNAFGNKSFSTGKQIIYQYKFKILTREPDGTIYLGIIQSGQYDEQWNIGNYYSFADIKGGYALTHDGKKFKDGQKQQSLPAARFKADDEVTMKFYSSTCRLSFTINDGEEISMIVASNKFYRMAVYLFADEPADTNVISKVQLLEYNETANSDQDDMGLHKKLKQKEENERKLKQKLQEMEQKLKLQEQKDNEDEKTEYVVMEKRQRVYKEVTKSTGIDIAVGKIAKLIIAGIGTFATNGALLPALAAQLNDAVVRVTWSTSDTNEKIVEQFFKDNCYLFLMIDRKIDRNDKRIVGIGKKEYKIIATTKFFYAEAANKAAIKELQSRANKEKEDAFEWIDENKPGRWLSI